MAPKKHPPKKPSIYQRKIKPNQSYFEGTTNVKDGDLVGGNKVIGLQSDELIRLIEAIFAPNYQTPERFDSVLQEFQKIHKTLYEWKELHNLLDEIMNSFNQFYSQIERLNGSSAKPDLEELQLLWSRVSIRVTELVEFAKNITQIGDRYVEDQDHLLGERWVLEILSLRNDLEKIFDPDEQVSLEFFSRGVFSFGVKPQWWKTMYRLTHVFYDKVFIHMHEGDKKLRESATNLYHLSEAVFQRR